MSTGRVTNFSLLRQKLSVHPLPVLCARHTVSVIFFFSRISKKRSPSQSVEFLPLRCSSQLNSRRMKRVGTVSINKLRFIDLLRQLIPNDTRLMIKDLTAQTFFFNLSHVTKCVNIIPLR